MDNSGLLREGLWDRRWWAVILRGLIAIAFAVLAFTWPVVTVATLVLLFGLMYFIPNTLEYHSMVRSGFVVGKLT